MIRTVDEEECTRCGVLTNAYDQLAGRLCPLCIAKRCAQFGKSLAMRDRGFFTYSFDPDHDMKYLANSNKTLLTEPTIDHNDDIDKGIQSPFQTTSKEVNV
jgi:hypothetical protein